MKKKLLLLSLLILGISLTVSAQNAFTGTIGQIKLLSGTTYNKPYLLIMVQEPGIWMPLIPRRPKAHIWSYLIGILDIEWRFTNKYT
jgi:hypothetical protein